MGRLVLFLTFMLFQSANALVPENIFQNDLDLIDKALANHTISKPYFLKLPSEDKFDLIRKDPKNLILDDFNIPEYFSKRVHFWFNIYTLYPSSSVVIHDSEDLDIVYNVIDFSELQDSIINSHTVYALQARYTEERIHLYKKAFNNLARGKKNGEIELRILKALDKAGHKFPSKKRRKKFFNNLSNNIRAQTGQKDNILQGYVNYLTFKPFMDKHFETFNLPTELLAIPFLESSFNTKATSKVGATGIWQFMPFIGKLFMPVDETQDARNNPVISTISAFHLLKQNKMILKRWDLAVTAYNSGTKHIIRAKRKYKKKDMSLEYMLTHYDHPHIGFASSNFYSSFLALVHTLAYKKELLGIDENMKAEVTFNDPIRIYVSKCSLRPDKIYNSLSKSSPYFPLLNKHFKNSKKVFGKGTILISDIELTKRKYLELDDAQIRKNYPKNYKKLVKNYNCSSR
ncbi:MAG: hypothetical protein EP319_10135 [Deltaproteobacteria bacterium]|nr:MAG: hypothetical protein EP319_10135 [Deltaproteobacteria bacterium]